MSPAPSYHNNPFSLGNITIEKSGPDAIIRGGKVVFTIAPAIYSVGDGGIKWGKGYSQNLLKGLSPIASTPVILSKT